MLESNVGQETSRRHVNSLALVGMAGSGKSTAVAYLARHANAPTIYLGASVMEVVAERGLKPGENSERIVREDLRRQHGMAAAAVVAEPKILETAEAHETLVIDGLYSWAEHEFLSRLPNIRLHTIAIHADRSVREARMGTRSVRPLGPADLWKRDLGEVEMLDKATPIALADFHISNNGSSAELELQLDRVLHMILGHEFA